jgi:hypothetical protein
LTAFDHFPSHFPGYSQIAYVTSDLDRALLAFRDLQGLANTAAFRSYRFQTGPGREACIDFALGYLGDIQLEIIQPLDGDVGIYEEALADSDFSIRFHHVCKVFDTEDQFDRAMAKLEAEGTDFPIVVQQSASPDTSKVRYADHRSMLGHYIEYAFFDEQTRAWMASMPRNDISS